MPSFLLDAAQTWAAAGFSVVPVMEDGSKRPMAPGGRWEQYIENIADDDTVLRWFGERNCEGLGIVCGTVSGGVECLDFDTKEIWAEYESAARACGLGILLDRLIHSYSERTPRGVHLFWRCEQFGGSQKLASNGLPPPHEETLIETKGEGGFVIIAPSTSKIHKLDIAYEVMGGEAATVASVTEGQRASLLALARTFCKKKAKPKSVEWTGGPVSGDRPGDLLDEGMTWPEILEPHGWVRSYTDKSGKELWRRPGKKSGVSATLDYDGHGVFYVFTSSTVFEPSTGYGKFAAFALLNHNNDFSLAADDAMMRFGVPIARCSEPVGIEGELDAFLAKGKLPAKKPMAVNVFAGELPGKLQEVADWMVTQGPRYQPEFAAVGALALAGALMGPKWRTSTGIRPNGYWVLMGPTACGKDTPRRAIARILVASRTEGILIGDVRSGQGLLSAVAESPDHNAIHLWDEIGLAMRGLKARNASGHEREILTNVIRLHSGAQAIFRGPQYADTKSRPRIDIDYPCLHILGTTVWESLAEAMGTGDLLSGFANRFLWLDSPQKRGKRQAIGSPDVPGAIADWAAFIGDGGGVMDTGASACEVEHSEAALAVLGRFAEKCDRRMDKLGAGLGDLWGRAWEHVSRISMIAAVAGLNAAEIDAQTTQWACDLVTNLTDGFIEQCKLGMYDSETERVQGIIAALIKSAGSSGIRHRDLTRKTQSMSMRDRADALRALGDAERIEVGVDGRAKKYRWR